MLEDLGRVRVLLRRHVPGLFEQRHVDERCGVALRAGVAVPVPGAAEVAALLDDAHVVDAGLLQPRAGDEAGEAAADERDGDVVGLRRRARRPACTDRRGSGRDGPSAGGTARCRRAAAACRAPRRTSAAAASLSISGRSGVVVRSIRAPYANPSPFFEARNRHSRIGASKKVPRVVHRGARTSRLCATAPLRPRSATRGRNRA